MDNRKALPAKEELIFDLGKKYIIIEETGRGASSLVYTASYQDLSGLWHTVRIKECFPYDMGIKRAADNALLVPKESQAQFLEAKEKFYKAYKKNVHLKNTLGIMNSTINSMEIYQKNHTWYCVTGIIEGMDYRQYKDSCLLDIFIRMEALCEIIKKYHAHGYLHLDIKPENILILPETREHIVLFDFDSVVLKEDLKNKTETRLFCSGGFSAPELIDGRLDRIDKQADIYSIGAVVYYKIFNKAPELRGFPLGRTFDFSKMNFSDKRYQPEFYKKINLFFQKTLSTFYKCRYEKIEDVICHLKELQKLSDIESMFLYSNFSYHSVCFVGREQELFKIGQAFLKNRIVFLSGTGGIGKTEIAKRYAYEQQEQYGKIVFAEFYHSICETVCGPDFDIHGIEREKEEAEKAFFKRKLGILKNMLTEDDLVILDNFDVETDEYLEALFECPCRFLVTTREDFRDYNYLQITVDKMADIYDLLELVRYYNEEEYTESETSHIERLLELVEYHTMTVELIAKYLRCTKEAPSLLLKRIESIRGITNTEEEKVKHRKDRKLRVENVVGHLRILFDLSKFSAAEEEIMMSLSLLGAVRIQREVFLEYFDMRGKIEKLNNLIQRGWIEFDEQSEKISLHQIILDLVYNEKKTTAELCPQITLAMTEYAKKRCANQTEKEIKRRFLADFMQRITGSGLAFADFLTTYCEQIRRRREYADKAEEICKAYLENQCRTDSDCQNYSSNGQIYQTYSLQKVYGLLYKICNIKIQLEADYSGMLLSEMEEAKYFFQKSENIFSFAQNAYRCLKNCGGTEADLGRACIETAFKLDHAVSEAEIYIEENTKGAFDKMLDYASYLLSEAEIYLSKADMPSSEKEKLFEKIQSFYSGEDFSAIYRSEKYGDTDKAWHYQKILDTLRRETENSETLYFHSNDVTYFEMAQKAEQKGAYDRAEFFYKKEIDEGNMPYEISWKALADLYRKMHRLEETKKCLETILSIEKEQRKKNKDIGYSSYIGAELARLLILQGNNKEAEKSLRELIFYNKGQGDMEWLLFGNYYLYKIEESEMEKERLWNSCLIYYEKIQKNGEILEELTDFVIEYLSKIEDKNEQIKSAVLAVESWRTCGYSYEKERMAGYILDTCESSFPEYILVLIEYAENLRKAYDEKNTKELWNICQRAQALYYEQGKEDKYIYSLICKGIGQCYWDMGEYDKGYKELKKCNYYLLAQTQGEKLQQEREDEVGRLWEEAAEAYSFVENWEMAEQCYQERFSQKDLSIGWYQSDRFEENWILGVKRLKSLFAWEHQREALLWAETLMKELFDKVFEEEKEKRHEYKAEWFGQKLKEIADILAEGKLQKESGDIYFLSVIAGLQSFVPKEIFYCFLRKSSSEEDMKQEFKKALSGAVTGKMVDFAIEIWSCIQKLDCCADIRETYKADMEEFLKRCRNQAIEFKRENSFL